MSRMKKGEKWKPDPNMMEILQPFYDMSVGPQAVKNQPVPQNTHEITKWPAIRVMYKYWSWWTDELVEQQKGTLAQTQRNVKAKYLNSYDKQIMICESQIQLILQLRQEHKAVYLKKAKVSTEKGESTIDPYEPNIELEKLLSTLNQQMGGFKMSKAQLEVAPIIDQVNEDAIIKMLQDEQDMLAKKVKKVKPTK